jgi:hypothetical protein
MFNLLGRQDPKSGELVLSPSMFLRTITTNLKDYVKEPYGYFGKTAVIELPRMQLLPLK